MNRLSVERRAQILGMLAEGNSLRATTRMAGVSINTVSKLLLDVGEACAEYQNDVMRNLSCQRVEYDEISTLVYAETANVPECKRDELGYGDIWTWAARHAEA